MTRRPSGPVWRRARPARPIVPGERIHVLGIAGAGASAAALLAHAAGAVVSGCDPGGPSPYTVAVAAAGIPMAWGHDAAHVTAGAAGSEGRWRGASDGETPQRLAVTKALTAIDPDNAELAAARAAGIPIEPWQQVVADAATGRRLVAIAGTHGKSTTSGWLVDLLVGAGEDPSAFVGALLPSRVTGGPPATARVGAGRAFVVEADEYAGNFDAYQADIAVLTGAEWDHPDVFADEAAVVATFVRWIERGPADGVVVLNAADPGRAGGPGGARYRSYRGHLSPAGRGDGRRGGGRRTGDIVGRIVAAEPDATILAVRGLTPDGAERTVRLRTAGRHNAANALAVAGAAVRARGRAGRHRGRPRGVRGRRSPAGAQGRGGRGRGLRRLRPPSDGHPRDHRGHPPAGAGPAGLGGLRAADLPSDGGPAGRLRRCAGHGRRGGHRRHLGRPRSGHDHRLGRRAGRSRQSGRRSDRPSHPAMSSPRPIGWPRRSAPATSCWSWVAATAIESPSACWNDWESTDR